MSMVNSNLRSPPPENSAAFTVASNLAQNIAANILSSYASALTDPVFGALGVNSNDASSYNSQILGALQQIEGSLNNISNKLTALSVAVSAIGTELTSISSEVTSSELQNLLAQYCSCEAIISQNYAGFIAALQAMKSVDPPSFLQGTNQLYSLFSIANTNLIASNLQSVCLLLGGGNELKGIVDFQQYELQQTYLNAAKSIKPITQPAPPPHSSNSGFTWAKSYVDGSAVLDAFGGSVEPAFRLKIIPTLTAAYACMLQGLHFLCSAWGGTINESRLGTITAAINGVGAKTGAMVTGFDLDAIVSTVLQQSCQHIDAGFMNQTWHPFNVNNPTATFDPSFVFWTVTGTGSGSSNPQVVYINGPYVAVVRAPWTFGQCETWQISDNPIPDYLDAPWYSSWSGTPYSMNNAMGPLVIDKPSGVGITLPPSWSDFIGRLPMSDSVLSSDRGAGLELGDFSATFFDFSENSSQKAISALISISSSNLNSLFCFYDSGGNQIYQTELKGVGEISCVVNFQPPIEFASSKCANYCDSAVLNHFVVRYRSGTTGGL